MLFTIPLLDIKECYSEKRGLGGNAPNKLKASAAGKGSELASDPCRRHGQKLVLYIKQNCPRMEKNPAQNGR